VRIAVRSFGSLKLYFGAGAETIELPAGATLRDLIETWEARHHESMPAHLWNDSKRWFRGPVIVMVEGQKVSDPDSRLRDQQEVCLFKAVVGG
jgi:sulfur carrier protein ThiS